MMKKTILVHLPTAVLWQFREFKRDEVPAPKNSFVPTYSVDEVTHYVKNKKGTIEPVELSIIGNRALLTDGNHRIVAAQRLGFKMIPVNLVVFFGEDSHPFYDHTIQRFKPLSRHLELWLKRAFMVIDFKRFKVIKSQELLCVLNFKQHHNLN
ncbi:hypothetical protein [Chryseolinea sp. H1M3-3]|uniref:hypothetical protein n=1 Tax=Chryseolinea sp. H1M3-3 TaxID=3034144 RepID=UPI0023EAE87E|nr:hypothetical protein [Chryseolinea sp. H1M3-3]